MVSTYRSAPLPHAFHSLSHGPTELSAKLQSSTAEELDAFTKRVAEELSKVDVTQQIEDLKRDVLLIKQDLDKIYTAVGYLDAQNYQRKKPDGTLEYIKEFQPAWDLIRQEFEHHLWESRKIATNAASKVQDYREAMIPLLFDESVGRQDKQSELEEYIEGLEEDVEAAQQMSSNFMKIPVHIQEFKEEITEALAQVEVWPDEEMDELSNRIQALRAKIDKQKSWADIAKKFTIGGLGAEAVCAGLVLVFSTLLGPIGLGIVMGAAFLGTAVCVGAAITERNIGKAMEANQAQLIQAEIELASRRDDIHKYTLIKEQVEVALACTDGLCSRLDGLTLIWAAIRTDAQSMLNVMKAAERAPTDAGFNRRMKNVVFTSSYLKLEQMLFSYANSVVPSQPSGYDEW